MYFLDKVIYNLYGMKAMKEQDLRLEVDNNMWREYRPEILSRRGEFFAWFITFLVLAAWLFLIFINKPAPISLLTLFSILLLIALFISLGNWMDRKSYIRISPKGIVFENGLRHVEKRWDEINKIEVHPSKWGAKVRVLCSDAHFSFRTLGVVTVGDEEKGRMGYQNGDKILHMMIEETGLTEIKSDNEGKYYIRK
jgi:hypothetical protein